MHTSFARSVRGLTLCAVLLTGAVTTASCSSAVVHQSPSSPITEADVEAAQNRWCDALVTIGKVYLEHGDYKAEASRLIDELYDYQGGKVFFKPTKAFGAQTFRPTKAGALAYFVGGDPNFPNDDGFAVKTPWKSVRAINNAAPNGIQIHGDIAITMGNVYFTDYDKNEIMVDKTFVFRRDATGRLRLCAHHSSLPYQPGP